MKIADFTIILYAPVNLGVVKKKFEQLQPRVRKMSSSSMTFLMGKLGLEHTVPLIEGHIKISNDNSGIVYVSDNGEMKIDQGIKNIESPH